MTGELKKSSHKQSHYFTLQENAYICHSVRKYTFIAFTEVINQQKTVMKIQPCTAEKEIHCYIWLKREKYVGIIQNSSWVLRKNWKKWELRPRPWGSWLTLLSLYSFLISGSASSSLLSSSCWRCCSGRVSELLPLVGSLSIDRRWRRKKGMRKGSI